MQEISPIKSRIIQYLENKEISFYKCYAETEMSRGILSQNNGLSEDNLLKFLKVYTDVNPIWLVTGEGDMFLEDSLNTQVCEKSRLLAENAHLEKTKSLNKNSYPDEFVEQLLVDHSKLTDSHLKLTEAHYLLTVEVTNKNVRKRKPLEYKESDVIISKVAERGEEYKVKK